MHVILNWTHEKDLKLQGHLADVALDTVGGDCRFLHRGKKSNKSNKNGGDCFSFLSAAIAETT